MVPSPHFCRQSADAIPGCPKSRVRLPSCFRRSLHAQPGQGPGQMASYILAPY
jgi:hypothetical protein